MRTPVAQKVLLLAAVAMLALGWSLVVWMAVTVSQNLLGTLEYIVDLAQMTP